MDPAIRVCSLASAAYLPRARVLADSLRLHDPGSELLLLLVDRADAEQYRHEPFRVITLADVADATMARHLAFQYGCLELCTALKARLHAYVLDHTDWERWLFLDSDIMVWSSLAPVFRELDECAILLSPHSSAPYGLASDALFERELLKVGVFNGGMLGLRRGPTAAAFVSWYRDRLDRFCFEDEPASLLLDQSWLTLVPAFFPQVRVLRHPGANVAFWNLATRELTCEHGRMRVDDEPLLFFHYSGLELPRPTRLSRHELGTNSLDRPAVREIVEAYLRALTRAGRADAGDTAYGHGHYADATPIGDDDRRAYREAWRAGRAPADPFARPGRRP